MVLSGKLPQTRKPQFGSFCCRMARAGQTPVGVFRSVKEGYWFAAPDDDVTPQGVNWLPLVRVVILTTALSGDFRVHRRELTTSWVGMSFVDLDLDIFHQECGRPHQHRHEDRRVCTMCGWRSMAGICRKRQQGRGTRDILRRRFRESIRKLICGPAFVHTKLPGNLTCSYRGGVGVGACRSNSRIELRFDLLAGIRAYQVARCPPF
jgi:hypothetical protein